jgi:hypothetical protein
VNVNYGSILIMAFAPLVVRIALYLVVIRVRGIRIRPMQLIIVAGAPYLVSFIPLPLPQIVSFALSLFAASFLLIHYADVELYPDGLIIPVVVEVASAFLTPLILAPFV